MCIRTVATGVASLLIVLLFLPAALADQTQGKQGCSVETNTAVISSHLSSIFSSDDTLVKDTFTNEQAQLFIRLLGAMYPNGNVPRRAEIVFAFSAQGKTLLLFFNHACIATGFLTSYSGYVGIKAKMHSGPMS